LPQQVQPLGRLLGEADDALGQEAIHALYLGWYCSVRNTPRGGVL
jgi:hypothetical protein